MYTVDLVNIFTEYVNIYLGDAEGEFILTILPESSMCNASWD